MDQLHTLSSLEILLLKHDAEAIEFNIGERISLLLAKTETDRTDVASNVREAFRLRRRQATIALTPFEQKSLEMFIFRAYNVLYRALQNIDAFSKKSDFIDAIDRITIDH